MMQYLLVKCAACEMEIRHYLRHLPIKKNRICPKCGANIRIAASSQVESPGEKQETQRY